MPPSAESGGSAVQAIPAEPGRESREGQGGVRHLQPGHRQRKHLPRSRRKCAQTLCVPGQQLHQREDPLAALKRGRISRLCTKCIRTRPCCVENMLEMLIDNQSTPLPRLFSSCLAFARRHFVQSLSDGHDISLLSPRSGASAHDRPRFRLHFYLVTKSLFAWYQQKRVVQCDIPRLAPG